MIAGLTLTFLFSSSAVATLQATPASPSSTARPGAASSEPAALAALAEGAEGADVAEARRSSVPTSSHTETDRALAPTLLAVGAAGFLGPVMMAGLVGTAGYAGAQLPGLRHTARSLHWQLPAAVAIAGALAAALASFVGLGAGVVVTAIVMAPPADALAVVGAAALSAAGAAAAAAALSVTVLPVLSLLALLPMRPGPRASRFSRSLYASLVPAAVVTSATAGLAVLTPVSAAFAFWVGGAAFAQHRQSGGARLPPTGAE